MAVIVSKIVKRVVIQIIFTSHARNVCFQREHKGVDISATSPTACSMISVIQIYPLVLDASFQFVDIRDLGTCWKQIFRERSLQVM